GAARVSRGRRGGGRCWVRDLRGWVTRPRRAGELAEVDAEVDPNLEITESADRVVKAGGPALLFRRVRGSSMPVLINQFGSERRIEMALGVERLEDLAERIQDLIELQPPQGLVEKVRAPGKPRGLGSFASKTLKGGPGQG